MKWSVIFPDSPAKTGPGARGPRGPYMTARKKAEMSASAKKSPAILAKNKKPHANTGKQGTFHGNQFYDKFGNPKVPGLAPRKMPAGTGAPALTSAKLQPVAYENAEADDPLSGGGGGGDPLSGGGDPLTGSQVSNLALCLLNSSLWSTHSWPFASFTQMENIGENRLGNGHQGFKACIDIVG